MSHFHCVVWIDHQKATSWQFSTTEQTKQIVHSHDAHRRIHSRKDEHGGHKSAADHHFFEDVVLALAGAHEILILGPAQTKQEFADYLRAKHAELARGIVAVENADHPSDPELLAYARKHFAALDRMFQPSA